MKKTLWCGLVLATVLSSCMKDKNLYDEDRVSSKKQEEYNKNFPVKDLDPNQDWSTFEAIKANVTVNEDALETYTIKLYTANPMDEETNPLLLLKADVKNGETFSSTIEIPKDLKSIWAVRLDKHNRCLFKQGTVVGGVVDVVFGDSNSNKRTVTSRAIATRAITAPVLPYTDTEVNSLISKATLATSGNISTPGTYLINSGANLSNLTVSGSGVIVIVQGEVQSANVTNNAQLILNGNQSSAGKLSGTIEISNSLLYVMPGSTFVLDRLTVQNNSKVYLKGQDNKQSHITTLSADATSTFINYYGRLVMETVTATNLENYCYMQLTSNNMSTINNLKMGQHSYLAAKQLQTTNASNSSGSDLKGEWYLDDYSVVDVETNFRAIRTNIFGPEGHEYALLRIKKNYEYNVEGSSTNGINIGYLCNNIYVELETISAGKNTSIYKLIQGLNGAGEIPGQVTHGNGNATLTLLFNAPVYIEPSECSGDGNKPNDGGSNMPEDKKISYTFAFEDLGSIGDYDFNDVVLKVTDGEDNYHFNVYLAAAGGTLPVKVELWNNLNQKYITLWEEIHSAFGVSQSTMVNTGGASQITLPKKEKLYKDYFEGMLYSNAKFRITVGNEDKRITEIISAPKKGVAPQCLRIAGDWKWPIERANITEAYPNFASWAQGNTGTGWVNNPNTEMIYSK